MMRRLMILLLAGIAARAADSAVRTVGELDWIAGHWTGEMWKGQVEEVWTTASAGVMMGMFRFTRDGKLNIYELLAIEQEADGPVLRLRHFRRGLTPVETDAIAMHLVKSSAGEAVFETRAGKRVKLQFRRTGADAMEILLERDGENGPKTDVFRYARKR